MRDDVSAVALAKKEALAKSGPSDSTELIGASSKSAVQVDFGIQA
jgi:hypothetical protein